MCELRKKTTTVLFLAWKFCISKVITTSSGTGLSCQEQPGSVSQLSKDKLVAEPPQVTLTEQHKGIIVLTIFTKICVAW